MQHERSSSPAGQSERRTKGLDVRLSGSCECGTCTFEASQLPKARLICHCTICQAFTGNAFSDVLIYPATRVALHNESQTSFRFYKKHHWPPPNLNRGRCTVCDRPVVEVFGSGPLKILFIPAANFSAPELMPAPGAHLFYEHRQADSDDGIPKHYGYALSQLAVLRLIMQAL